MNLLRAPIQQLEMGDRAFDLGFARRTDMLRRSVAAVGVLQPLVVRQRADGRYQIVCGFGRASAAHDLGLAELPVFVLDMGVSDADCLRLALFDNLPHRQFNPIERAIILTRFGPYVDREHLISDYMPLLGMRASAARLDRTRALTNLIDRLKWAVAEGRMEEKVGVSLALLSGDDQGALAELLDRCQPSVSMVREWADALADIARRDGTTVREILAKPEMSAALSAADMTTAERTAAVRRGIHCLRFPTLSAHEARFNEGRAALRLPPTMQLEPAPNFESDEMRLAIRFRNQAELRNAMDVLSRWFDDPNLLGSLWFPARPADHTS